MPKIPDDDSGGILMPILVSLLVVIGIGTAGLFGYIGIRLTTNPPEEVPASSVAQPHEQPQISGVRVPPENNDAEGQTQVSDKPDDVQASSAEPSAPEAPATVPEEENRPQTTQPPEKQPETKPTQPSGTTGQKDNGTSNNGQTGTGKTPENQQQTGVNLNPSSPSASEPQDSGTNVVTKPSGRTIYITPTGKRYHYDGNCNGGTYIESTLDEANRLGLTPCNKCVN